MKRIKYTGPFDAVDVPDAGLEGVAQGAVVEVDDDMADRLLEQPDNWRRAPKPRKRPGGQEG